MNQARFRAKKTNSQVLLRLRACHSRGEEEMPECGLGEKREELIVSKVP